MSTTQEVQELIFRADTTGLTTADAAVKRYATSMDAAHESSKRATGGVSGLGQSLLNIGRITDDYNAAGLRGIVNNFEGLAMSLGLGAGVAGVVTVAAIALKQFLPVIQEFLGLGKTFELPTKMEELEKRIDALKDAKVKVDADGTALKELQDQLKELQKAAEEFQATISGQTKEEKEAGKRVSTFFGTAEGRQALRDAQQRQKAAVTAPIEAQAAQAEVEAERTRQALKTAGPGDEYQLALERNTEAESKLVRLREQAKNAAAAEQERLDRMLKEARTGTGDEQQRAIDELGGVLGGVGPGQAFAAQRGRMRPDAIQREEQIAAIAKQEADRQKEIQAEQAKRAQAAEKAAREQERVQRETEKAMEEERQDAFDQEKARNDQAKRAAEQQERDARERERLAIDQQQAQIEGNQLTLKIAQAVNSGVGLTLEGAIQIREMQLHLAEIKRTYAAAERELRANRARAAEINRTAQNRNH
jgi:hypothetical protein